MLLKTNEFKSIFGNDYYVAVLVKNKDVFSKRSLTLIRESSEELKDSLSLTDLEFTVGTEEGMTVEQIVIPSDETSLKEIRRKAIQQALSLKEIGVEGRYDDMDHGEPQFGLRSPLLSLIL